MTSACSSGRACHAISNVVLDVATALLREHADKNGMLRLADAERILELIGRGTMSLDGAFKVQQERCRIVHSRPKGNVGARSNPFQRLMVRPFESLLAGDNAVFPRPYLVNYFVFVERALADDHAPIDQDCRAIIQALLVVYGNNLTWDHFYSDPRTLRLLHRALRILVHTLCTQAGTRLWDGLLSRPVAGQPPLPPERIEQVRSLLLETHRGLSAA